MRSRLEIKSGIELAAMVDVVFLLVTYFLINATLSKNPVIKIALPKSITAQTETQQKTIVYIDNANKIYVNDQQVDLPNLGGLIKKTVKDPENDLVIIKGDKESSYQTIITVIDSVNQAGINHFNLATEK